MQAADIATRHPAVSCGGVVGAMLSVGTMLAGCGPCLRAPLSPVCIGPSAIFECLDSRRQDSDGDGLPDALEVLLGTDPHAADSDHDGRIDGYDPCPLLAGRGEESPDRDVRQTIVDFLVSRFGAEHVIVAVGLFDGEPVVCYDRVPGLQLHGREDAYPFSVLHIITLTVQGDDANAEAGLIAPMWGCVYRISLRRVGGVWVILDAQPELCA